MYEEKLDTSFQDGASFIHMKVAHLVHTLETPLRASSYELISVSTLKENIKLTKL